MTAPYSTTSVRRQSVQLQSVLSQWLSTIGLWTTRAPVDRRILKTWLREGKEMRARASTLSEKPPLLSY